MLKRGVANEKIEISSKEFTKKFIKNFILNGLVIGILIGIIYELVTYFVKNSIIKEIFSFLVIFFAINRIHIAAIKDTFYNSYILNDNIRKAKNNVTIFFVLIALVNIVFNVRMYNHIISVFLGTSYLKWVITKNIINVVLYVIIIIFCRDEIDKQCSESNKNEKNYLIKNIILVFIFTAIVIAGTIFIKSDINISLKNEQNNNQEINDDIVTNSKSGLVNVSRLNEIDLKITSQTNTEYASYNAKSNDGKTELNISSYKTDITKTGPYDWFETVKDGVIVFCTGTENNYIEKIDTKGNVEWKKATSSKYKFNDVKEVSDGYFIKGEVDSKDIIAKIDTEGNIISTKYIKENLSYINFVESEKDRKDGKAQLIGRNNEQKNVIIKYDNECNQDNILYTKLNELVCEKIIEIDGYYYGIAADWAFEETKRIEKTVFKLDNIGNKVFEYNILDNNSFTEYLNEHSWIMDINVNNNYIFLFIANDNIDKDDIYVLDLDGNLKGQLGYGMNNKLNNGANSLGIGEIITTDEGIYIVGMIHYYYQNSQMFIDKISNDLNFEYRVNVPEVEESKLKIGIYGWEVIDNILVNAEFYDDYLMDIHQYKFN